MSALVTARLRAEPPLLHAQGTAFWGSSWAVLEWIERTVKPGWRTLETGAGMTTIVFAAAGATHESITPSEDEIARIRAECQRLDVPMNNLSFHAGVSHEVGPTLPHRPLDVLLLGGPDGFPYPIIDWWNLVPRLRAGGYLLVEPAYTPAVGTVARHLRNDPAWRVVGTLGYRTVLAEKLSDDLPDYVWQDERLGRGLNFGYLAFPRRVRATARHRFFTTRLGLAAVAFVRQHASWLFRPR